MVTLEKERLREGRNKTGLTQREASSALCLSRNMVAKYETGQARPSLDILEKIAALYEVKIGWLFGEGHAKQTATPAPAEKPRKFGADIALEGLHQNIDLIYEVGDDYPEKAILMDMIQRLGRDIREGSEDINKRMRFLRNNDIPKRKPKPKPKPKPKSKSKDDDDWSNTC